MDIYMDEHCTSMTTAWTISSRFQGRATPVRYDPAQQRTVVPSCVGPLGLDKATEYQNQTVMGTAAQGRADSNSSTARDSVA